ncbi:DedA family protein [Bacillus lacus]|uniref:DedA family protein n=1 Tax=Metabacillus lacus TaxID=1983721 RepID=A0A7X2LZC4_9BACI|nr:DedA family protein [Metabacillus lacus]MRX71539.1 DedA family protein [Metabacillus lacus]
MNEWVSFLFSLLQDMGYAGIALGLMVEVIPSEIVLGYGGYLILLGEISFWGACAAGVAGGTLAQLFLYWMGYYGGRPFLERFGKYLLISDHHLDLSEKWFETYGSGVIFSARFIPVVRHAISIPAGISKMPLWKFTIYTTAAVIPWTIFFLYLGMKLGSNWGTMKEAAAPYIIPLVCISVLVIILYLLVKKKK